MFQGGFQMKKEYLVVFTALLFMSMTTITAVYANEKKNHLETISEVNLDINGDGRNESVLLKGRELPDDDSPYQAIYLEVIGSNEKKQKVKIEGGFEPELLIKDFDHNGKNDILVSIDIDGSSDQSNYYLYTFENSKLEQLPTPEPLIIQSEFLDRYKAKIYIENNHKSHKFNLKARKENYEQTGIYHNGTLNEPMELLVDSYNELEPIKIKGNKVGLKANQIISGASKEDVIGRVESTWVFNNGKWELLGTKVFEVKDKMGKE